MAIQNVQFFKSGLLPASLLSRLKAARDDNMGLFSVSLTQLRRPAHHIRILPPMSQRVVDQHQRQHRLRNRGGANPDAGVVAAFGGHIHGIACLVDRVAREADAGGGFDGVVRDDVLASGYAAEDAARVVG